MLSILNMMSVLCLCILCGNISCQRFTDDASVADALLKPCTPCHDCKEPAEGTQLVPLSRIVKLSKSQSDHRQLFFVDSPRDVINFQYQLTLIRGDSSAVKYTIETKRPKNVNERLPAPTYTVRVKFFNQHGDPSENFFTIQGWDACYVETSGPPNIEGRLLMNVLGYTLP